MTVKINGYQVEIKAKGIYGSRYNNLDTREFLNELKNIFGLAVEQALNCGLADRIDEFKRSINEIVEVLLKNGFPENRL